jgi:hypothetical protein
MELTMQERKKLTIVKAQTYLKAGKTTKSAMLDDFCESTGSWQEACRSSWRTKKTHGHLHLDDETRGFSSR